MGTDPLLRVQIWSALRSLASKGTTGRVLYSFIMLQLSYTSFSFPVLLTTHYIEEAVNADIVAFLRGGRVLEEGRPEILLQRFSYKSLETLFYQLCYEDEKKYQSDQSEIYDDQLLLDDQIAVEESGTGDKVENHQEKDFSMLSDFNVANRKINFYIKTKALLFKNLMVLR